MTLSTSPCMMAVKQSVVGSGPTLLPGISCSSRYLSSTHTVCDFSTEIFWTYESHKNCKCWRQSDYILLDECCLSSGVLSHDQHHRLVIKVCILQTGRVEVMETIVLLERQQLLSVQWLEPFCHSADNLRCLLHIFSSPAWHVDWLKRAKEKGVSYKNCVGECLLFGAVFPVTEPWKTFRCFLYLYERSSLVLETSSAHSKRNDRPDVLFEVWIFPLKAVTTPITFSP